MVKMLLACAGGLSSSMVTQKMKAAAKAQNLDLDVDATSVGNVPSMIDGVQVLLLGPQMAHAKKNMEERFGDKCKVMVIDMMDYGRMNGEAILNKALALLKN